jgi:hypothetical protein
MSSTHPAAAFPTLAMLPLLTGCMSDMGFDASDTASRLDDSGAEATDSAEDTGEMDRIDPSWWSLSAAVLMEEGLPVQDDTSVTISLFDEGADRDAPLCQASYSQLEIVVLDSPDASIFHWWEIELGEASTDCSGHQLVGIPASFELGVGALHPDIVSLLEPAGYAEVEPYLYGAYVRTDQAQAVWIYGVAATTAGFAGEQLPVDEAPVPSGTYSVQPIYLLPLQGG